MSATSLERLLEHPAIWRGGRSARIAAVPTGFAALDARLPGGGWPQHGLIEILLSRWGVGELYLLLPALARLTQHATARWCAWVAPPFEPCAPALAAHGVRLERVLIVRAASPLWPAEQALRSGACDAVVTFVKRVPARSLRRLQLAAEQGRTLAFMVRTLAARTLQEPTCAALRLSVEPTAQGVRITLLKSRGGPRGSLELALDAWPA
jgi:hypothetical protein